MLHGPEHGEFPIHGPRGVGRLPGRATCAVLYPVSLAENLFPSSVRIGARVIALHDVGDARTFESRITRLAARFPIRGIAEILDGPGGPAAALTFDDGYEDWVTVALPVLRKLRIPATFFVSSGAVGLPADEARRFREACLRRRRDLTLLSRDGLRTLAVDPLCEIGGHTTHHRDLGGDIDDAEWAREVRADKDRLENLTGQRVRYFAYPFGAARNIPSRYAARLRASGYEAAFTIMPGAIGKASDRFLLPRCPLDIKDPWFVWRTKLSGSWHRLSRLKRRVLS